LFYVALTRAKKRAFVVTQECYPSSFVEELAGAAHAPNVQFEKPLFPPLRCPECADRSLVRRAKRNYDFWACSHYPYCEGKSEVCKKCNQGAMLRIDDKFECSEQDCDGSSLACPRCANGMLIMRTGSFGTFWGCSNWRREGGCGFRRVIE
jgi:DNA helicase-4